VGSNKVEEERLPKQIKEWSMVIMGNSQQRPLMWFMPEEPGPMVTLHASWGADFTGETSAFLTKEEAIEFCRKRWKRNDPIIREEQP